MEGKVARRNTAIHSRPAFDMATTRHFACSDQRQNGWNDADLYVSSGLHRGESWAAQLKDPQNRAETVGRALCEAAGGKCVGAWYCFGEYDLVLIADMPNAESMAAVALVVGAGGAVKSAVTTVQMSGAEGVEAMRKAATIAKSYKPAR